VTRLVDISPKVLQCKVGTLPMKHARINYTNPPTLSQRTSEDRGLTRPHDGVDVTFPPIDSCREFKFPFYSTIGRKEVLTEPKYIGELLELKHLSGSSTPDTKNLGSQSLEGVKKHKRHKYILEWVGF
jgi:hypothetical protein